MTPLEKARELRKLVLPQLASRKSDLQRLLKEGPSKPEDYSLLVSVLAFALAETSAWEAEQKLPPPDGHN
jgi:hypothetical protein